MNYKKLYISPIESIIPQSNCDIPSLEYVPTMVKRRYSVITKLTIEIVNRLTMKYDCSKMKQIYSTSTGEINKNINFTSRYDMEKEVSPSLFSMAVINATIALTSITFNLRAGYCVMLCNKNDFFTILQAGYSMIHIEKQEQVLIIYADEEIKESYMDNSPKTTAYGFILSKNQVSDFKEIQIDDYKRMSVFDFINEF